MSKIRPFPGPLQRMGVYRTFTLTEEQKQWLRDYFPSECGLTLRAMMGGVSLSTFYRLLKGLGLEKTDEARAKIYRHNAAVGKRTCEKNGYYASLRGAPPSQKCQEGSRRYWDKIHKGEELHPLLKLKKEHPILYKKAMRRRSEQRKKLIKMERFRVMSGLKQNTKLKNIRLQAFTRAQIAHRYGALKRGYWFYEINDTIGNERWDIYYDEETTRSERFEQNLKADGFNVVYKKMD